jgi:hypothetical protein
MWMASLNINYLKRQILRNIYWWFRINWRKDTNSFHRENSKAIRSVTIKNKSFTNQTNSTHLKCIEYYVKWIILTFGWHENLCFGNTFWQISRLFRELTKLMTAQLIATIYFPLNKKRKKRRTRQKAGKNDKSFKSYLLCLFRRHLTSALLTLG